MIKHLSKDNSLIFDDFESEAVDEREHEANLLARDAVVPINVWEIHKISKVRNTKKEHIINLENKIEIHPALVAGRVRYERKQYNIFSSLVGNREVRKLFI